MKRPHLIGALSAVVFGLNALSSHAAPISGQGTWESTLEGRDLDGNALTFEAYYDTTLDITWLADANAAGTPMNWADANTWADNLDVNGITGWRLPTNTPIDGSSYNTALSSDATTDQGFAGSSGWVDGSDTPVSEMGHMYYVTLGNLGFCDPGLAYCTEQTGWDLFNTADFLNVLGFYWSGSEFDSSNARRFNFNGGLQDFTGKAASILAWAVRPGDVSAVPVPAAVWLFGSGLIGLLGLARHKR